MSLFEQFFSDINKNFMFDMISKIFYKDNNIDIKDDKNNFELMVSKMKPIFDDNSFTDISDINEALLKSVLDQLKNKYNNNQSQEVDFDKSLEKLMEERNRTISTENTVENSKSTPIQELLNKNIEEKEEINKEEEVQVYVPPTIKINSNNRINIQSSRYNYIIDLKKDKILSSDLIEISKLIIPIEDNYIFNIPLLLLNIKELDVSIYLQQENLITNNNSTLGIYKPIEKYRIESKNVNRLTIDIRDMTGEKYKFNDILKINLIEIKDGIIIFTCSNVSKNNYKQNDMIKVLNINTFEIGLLEILSNPLKISAIKNNMIFCSFEGEYKNNLYNNIDMKIINMSNQNLLIFN